MAEQPRPFLAIRNTKNQGGFEYENKKTFINGSSFGSDRGSGCLPGVCPNPPRIYPSGWRCEGGALQTGFQSIAECRRHYHPSHCELFAACRLHPIVTERSDGA